MAEPTDSPLTEESSFLAIEEPPAMSLAAASGILTGAHQRVYDALLGELGIAATTFEQAAQAVQGDARRQLDEAVQILNECVNVASASILTTLSQAALLVSQTDVALPTEQDVQQIASALPATTPPLPGMSALTGIFGATPPLPVVDSGVSGGTFGISANPPLPDWATSYTSAPLPATGETSGESVSALVGGAVNPNTIGVPPVATTPGVAWSGAGPTQSPQPQFPVSGAALTSTTTQAVLPALATPVPTPLPPLVSGAAGAFGHSVAYTCPPAQVTVQAPRPAINVQPCEQRPPVVNVQVTIGGDNVTFTTETPAEGPATGSPISGQGNEVAPSFGETQSSEGAAQFFGPGLTRAGGPVPVSSTPVRADEVGEKYTLDALIKALADVRSLLADPVSKDGCALPDALKKSPLDFVTDLWEWLTGYESGARWKANSAIGSILSGVPSLLRSPVEFLVSNLLSYLEFQRVNRQILVGCDHPASVVVALARGLIGVVEGWVKIPLPEAHAHADQAMGMLCAARIPSTAEADRAFQLGYITEDTWRCWVRANGDRDDLHERSMLASSAHLSPMETVSWGLRGGKTRGDIAEELLKRGVANPLEARRFLELSEYLPSPGDLVSFMTRDVFDERVSTKYQYDEGLREKYTAQTESWGYSQGMTRDVFKYYWRSHWRLPSPTQAYEFIHRLRPGRVPDEVVTTQDEARELLEINDYPKYWRDRLIAVSYSPLTRTDTRRSFFLGSLSEEDTFQAILDLGYAEREAKHLLAFWKAERLEWVANRPWARAYSRGEIPSHEFEERLFALGLTPREQDAVELELTRRLEARLRVGSLRQIKRRVVRGYLEWTDALTELRALGYAGKVASLMAQGWDRERQARLKYPSTAELCAWADQGLIGPQEYAEALLRQGYSADDVPRLMETCRFKAAEKASKKGAAETRSKALEGRRVVSAKQREANRRNLLLARTVRAARQRAREEETVNKRLLATSVIAARFERVDVSDVADHIERMHGYLVSEKGYDRVSAAGLVRDIVTTYIDQKRKDWKELASAWLQDLPKIEMPEVEIPPDEGNGQVEQLPPPEVESGGER